MEFKCLREMSEGNDPLALLKLSRALNLPLTLESLKSDDEEALPELSSAWIYPKKSGCRRDFSRSSFEL